MNDVAAPAAAIPVVDISGLRADDPAERRRVAAAVGDHFFAQPLAVKAAVGLTDGVLNRGYDAPGGQQLAESFPATDLVLSSLP